MLSSAFSASSAAAEPVSIACRRASDSLLVGSLARHACLHFLAAPCTRFASLLEATIKLISY